mmetsp:Transcript_35210/g.139899  ORF Transcript_35210/g.139899 Transcript_35210/m.139899 type:complete len:116 (-) Transcript_35210:4089-4436(-)
MQALHEEFEQEDNDRDDRDDRGPDYDKPVNQRTPVMQWSLSRRGGAKKKPELAEYPLQQAAQDASIPITSVKVSVQLSEITGRWIERLCGREFWVRENDRRTLEKKLKRRRKFPL